MTRPREDDLKMPNEVVAFSALFLLFLFGACIYGLYKDATCPQLTYGQARSICEQLCIEEQATQYHRYFSEYTKCCCFDGKGESKGCFANFTDAYEDRSCR